jgi:hypothetical protein
MSFKDLKKSKNNLFSKIQQQLEEGDNKKQSKSKDERFWKIEMGKDGTGYAVIRFLPAVDGEDLPWVKTYNHGFQGPDGAWFIEDCPTTINGECPLCKYNRTLWNTKLDSKIEQARNQKRKLSYISNIYVVSDPAHPENEGKVFMFKYGAKIFEKVMSAMQPEFEDEEPLNPFDFWEGADFKLKLCKVAGYWNYDKSGFARPGVLDGLDDDQLEVIYGKQYPLAEFVDPKRFKTPEALQERLDVVLGNTPKTTTKEVEEEEEEKPRARRPRAEDDSEVKFSPSKFKKAPVVEEDEEDPMSYFQRLASE